MRVELSRFVEVDHGAVVHRSCSRRSFPNLLLSVVLYIVDFHCYFCFFSKKTVANFARKGRIGPGFFGVHRVFPAES